MRIGSVLFVHMSVRRVRCNWAIKANRKQGAKKFAPIAALERVEQHRSQNDDAEHDLLRVTFDTREIHSILNDGDDQRADERAENAPLPAAETGATDDDRGDDVKFVSETIGGRTALERRCQHDSAQPGKP